jgi:hypothetical protein
MDWQQEFYQASIREGIKLLILSLTFTQRLGCPSESGRRFSASSRSDGGRFRTSPSDHNHGKHYNEQIGVNKSLRASSRPDDWHPFVVARKMTFDNSLTLPRPSSF